MRLSGWLLTLGLVVSSLAAGAVALQRLQVEQANRAVELVLDYPDVAQWASASKARPSPSGCVASVHRSASRSQRARSRNGACRLPRRRRPTCLARRVSSRRSASLRSRRGWNCSCRKTRLLWRYARQQARGFGWSAIRLRLMQIGLGLDPVQVAQVRAGGKPIVARLINPQGITPLALRGSLLFAREQGASLLIFAGDQVLGYRPGLQATAHNIQANAMRFGAIEFAKQAGAGNLSQAIPEHTVRVHSVSGLPSRCCSRPARLSSGWNARAQERNIRVLYLRAAGADTATLREILQQLEQRLHRAGYAIRESGARPFERIAASLCGSSCWWGWAWACWRAGC
jgi:hypothetical protein